MKRSKIAEEIRLIALLSLLIPTAMLLTLSPFWWACEPIKVFAGYLLGILGTAAVLGGISLYDEAQKERESRG